MTTRHRSVSSKHLKLASLAFLATGLLAAQGRDAAAQEACAANVPVDGVQLFDTQNFAGGCVQFRLGNFGPHLGFNYLGTFGWNDRARSFKTGSQVRTHLFTDAGFRGSWHNTENSLAQISPVASSLRIENRSIFPDCSNVQAQQVAVYEHADFTGDCFVMNAKNATFAYDLPAVGFANDSVSSVRNFSSYRLFLCWHANCATSNGLEYGQVSPWTNQSYVGGATNDKTTMLSGQLP